MARRRSVRQRMRIRTIEKRYIVPDDAVLRAVLSAHGTPLEYVPGRTETLITTVYFDTAKGTWSTGPAPTKIRARSYGEPEQWWFELKRRVEDRVDKWRRPMSPSDVVGTLSSARQWNPVKRLVKRDPLQPVFCVRCRRTSYEWPGLRVTLDRDVTFYPVDPSSPLEPSGDRLGWVEGVVVEVKCEYEHPDWLRSALESRRASGYSKSRYALALIAGEQRPFLGTDRVTHVPRKRTKAARAHAAQPARG